MCRRTPLSWQESFEQGTVSVLRAQEGFGGAGYNAQPEGSLCRIRLGQPGSSANLTPTKRGSALRRRSRQDSSQRVIKFQVRRSGEIRNPKIEAMGVFWFFPISCLRFPSCFGFRVSCLR